MRTTEWVKLNELLPADLVGNLDGEKELFVPEWAFLPDAWSFAFQRGLRKLPFKNNSVVWEIGCGTGLNLVLLRSWFPTIRLRYSDYEEVCVDVAANNLVSTVGLRYTIELSGRWDLVTPIKGKVNWVTKAMGRLPVDYIVACIPQIPAKGLDLDEADNRAHYYNPDDCGETQLNVVGLGLVDTLLAKARKVLKPNGHIVLNLGGRPGHQRLMQMFHDRGYAPRVVHEEVIPQHQGTSLAPLAALEADGLWTFEFFTDSEGKEQINACQAEQRRLAALPLFHKIYVIEGTPLDRRRTVRGS